MSFLTRTALRAVHKPHVQRSPIAVPARRAFHPSRARAALSESDRSKDREDVGKEIDQHKHEQLQQQKEGKGQWKGELASNSESAVKADRGEMKATDENIKEMQEETVKQAK